MIWAPFFLSKKKRSSVSFTCSLSFLLGCKNSPNETIFWIMTCLSNQFLFHIKFVIFVSLQVPCFFSHKRNNTYFIWCFTNFESLAFINIGNYCEEHDIITSLGLLGKQALKLFEKCFKKWKWSRFNTSKFYNFTQLHGLCVSTRGINQNIRFSSKVAEKDGACNIMEFTSQEFWAQFMDLLWNFFYWILCLFNFPIL